MLHVFAQRRMAVAVKRGRWAVSSAFATIAAVALASATLVGCGTMTPRSQDAAWPATLYVNPQVNLPTQFRFVGNTGSGSNTVVVGHGFSSAIVQTDAQPEQARMQLLYEHNRKVIATTLVNRVRQEVAGSSRYQLADSLDAAQGEIRIDVLDVGITPAESDESVLPYFRAEMSLFDKAGRRLRREDVSMSNSRQLETEKAALLGDINGLRNFYDDGMRSVAQRALADLSK